MKPLNLIEDRNARMPRRHLFAALGGVGASLLVAPAIAQTTVNCLVEDAMTEGPYWIDEQLNRSDIRTDPSTGAVRPGTLLTLQINLMEPTTNGCSPVPNAMVDLWHCDASGTYSDEAANNTVGMKYLRGFQMTDSNGTVNFTTIYPGWYSGRTVHIHMRVRTYSGSTLTGQFVTQFFFDDSFTDSVVATAPYSTRGTRDTRNANDSVYKGATHPERSLLTVTQTGTGYAASINAVVALGSNATTTPTGTSYAVPQIAYGGGWYTAIYLANLNSSAVTAALALYGSSGTALQIPGLAGQNLQVGANGTSVIEFPNSGNLTQGWLSLTLPPGLVGYAVLRQSVTNQPDQETVLPFSAVASQNADLPYDDSTRTTTVAIANPGTSAIAVTVTAYRADGTVAGTSSMTLGARSQAAFALSGMNGLGAVSGTRGRATFSTASGSFSVLGVRFGGRAFAAIPVTYR